jgi:hypothetical protein
MHPHALQKFSNVKKVFRLDQKEVSEKKMMLTKIWFKIKYLRFSKKKEKKRREKLDEWTKKKRCRWLWCSRVCRGGWRPLPEYNSRDCLLRMRTPKTSLKTESNRKEINGKRDKEEKGWEGGSQALNE